MEIADKKIVSTDKSHIEVETPSAQKEVVLKVEGLYKKFCRNLKKSMIYGMLDIIKGFLGIKTDHSSLRKDEFWALQDINFELRENEILGIIGANGSGKSTLLRLLTGIYPPDQGKITLHGKVGGIIALGAGMHPHLTGRENIYLNGTILGMSKAELDAKFDEIVEFAELGEFLEAPLSTYSSGMKVRLGFAVAVHCEPEILLVDEVLAVGDLSFQNKCMRKLREIREKAKAVIFISHSMQNIEMLCDRVVVMDKGQIFFDGETKRAISIYQDLQHMIGSNTINQSIENSGNSESCKIRKIEVYDFEGKSKKVFKPFETFAISFDIEMLTPVLEPFMSIALRDEKGNNIYWEMLHDVLPNKKNLERGAFKFNITLNNPNLSAGKYFIVFGLKDASSGESVEKVVSDGYHIIISDEGPKRGLIKLDSKWTFE